MAIWSQFLPVSGQIPRSHATQATSPCYGASRLQIAPVWIHCGFWPSVARSRQFLSRQLVEHEPPKKGRPRQLLRSGPRVASTSAYFGGGWGLGLTLERDQTPHLSGPSSISKGRPRRPFATFRPMADHLRPGAGSIANVTPCRLAEQRASQECRYADTSGRNRTPMPVGSGE
jgi:hypothetical protein